MASTPPLSFTQPGGTTNVRPPNAPRFAGGPQGATSASGANTPREDSFTRSDGAVDVDAILAKSAADIGNVDDLLAMLASKEKASKNIEGANPFAALKETQLAFDQDNPYHAPIEDQTLTLQKKDARDTQVAKWGILGPAYKYLNPSTLDGVDRHTQETLQGLKDSGISMEDHFKTQNAATRTKHQNEYAALLDGQKNELRKALREQGVTNDEEIEARVKQYFEGAEPEMEQTLQDAGLNEADIAQLKQKTKKS